MTKEISHYAILVQCRTIEFFWIEFCRIYRIHRICRKLFLEILVFKTTKNIFFTNSIDSLDTIEINSE